MGSCAPGAGCGGENKDGEQDFRAALNSFSSHAVNCSSMPKPLDPQTKKHLASRLKYYKEMGIHDFYRRPVEEGVELALQPVADEPPVNTAPAAVLPPVNADKPAALKLIREDIG